MSFVRSRSALGWLVLSLCIFLGSSPLRAEDSPQTQKSQPESTDTKGQKIKPSIKAVSIDSLRRANGQSVHAPVASEDGHGEGAGQSRWAAALFWMLALMTMGGALFVITRRNLVAAVIGMIGTFFGISGLFLMLYAGFLAAIQVLVYAGAIMVLFVFVIMILNREEDEPWAVQGLLGKGIAGIGLAYLFVRLSKVLWSFKDIKAHLPAPGPVMKQVGSDWVQYPFGSVKGVGHTLFTQYLFPFEAVSLVLLVAVVGAIAVARPNEPTKGRKEVSA